MRDFVALFRREVRDARWSLVASAVVAAVAPWVVHAWAMAGADDELAALIGGRAVVPILFALFAAATASDLVARDVATHRIEALAVLPVPIARVWAAKAAFLGAASIGMLAWIVAADFVALEFGVSPTAGAFFPAKLADAAPSIAGGMALGAASLFFSTLLERGMSAALGALVVVVAIAAGIQWAEIPASLGAVTIAASYAVPLGLAAAFTFASRTSFVRGPIHGPSKLRLALTGLVALVAVLVPAGAATAFGLERSTRLAPGEGDAAFRAAYLSPSEKWVAVEDSVRGPGSRSATWLVGLDDGSCRAIAPGTTWFANGFAWLPGSMLHLRTSTFSILDGPRHVRALDVEPTRLGVTDDGWVRDETPFATGLATAPTWVTTEKVIAPGRSQFVVNCPGLPNRRYTARWIEPSRERGVIFVMSETNVLSRVTIGRGRDETSVELARNVGAMIEVSPDGKRLLIDGTTDRRVLDAKTGAVVCRDWNGRAKWLGGGRLLTWTETETHSVAAFAVRDLDAGSVVDLGTPQIADCVPRVATLRDGRLVVCDGDVTLRAADGKVIRRLFPPQFAGEKGN